MPLPGPPEEKEDPPPKSVCNNMMANTSNSLQFDPFVHTGISPGAGIDGYANMDFVLCPIFFDISWSFHSTCDIHPLFHTLAYPE